MSLPYFVSCHSDGCAAQQSNSWRARYSGAPQWLGIPMKFIRREKLNQGTAVHDLVYDLCDDNDNVVLKNERQGFATELASPQLAAATQAFHSSKLTVRPAANGHNTSHKFKLVLRARPAAQATQSDVIELK
jgi:hypothetical protein